MQRRLSSVDILTIASSCCGAQWPSISLDITSLSVQFILMFDINSNNGCNHKLSVPLFSSHTSNLFLFIYSHISLFILLYPHPSLLHTVALLNTWSTQLAPLFPPFSAAECDHFTVFPGLTSSNHRSAFRIDKLCGENIIPFMCSYIWSVVIHMLIIQPFPRSCFWIHLCAFVWNLSIYLSDVWLTKVTGSPDPFFLIRCNTKVRFWQDPCRSRCWAGLPGPLPNPSPSTIHATECTRDSPSFVSQIFPAVPSAPLTDTCHVWELHKESSSQHSWSFYQQSTAFISSTSHTDCFGATPHQAPTAQKILLSHLSCI